MLRTTRKKIGIQRQNDIGLIHAIAHLEILPKRKRGACSGILGSNCFIPMPLRGGISLQECSKLMGQCGRDDRFGQDPEVERRLS